MSSERQTQKLKFIILLHTPKHNKNQHTSIGLRQIVLIPSIHLTEASNSLFLHARGQQLSLLLFCFINYFLSQIVQFNYIELKAFILKMELASSLTILFLSCEKAECAQKRIFQSPSASHHSTEDNKRHHLSLYKPCVVKKRIETYHMTGKCLLVLYKSSTQTRFSGGEIHLTFISSC